MSTKNERYQEYKQQVTAVATARRNNLIAKLKIKAQALFAMFPLMTSFSWPQYTPYFNDGEECNFYVRSYDENIEINGINSDDQTDWQLDAASECSMVLNRFEDSEMKETFGDHVKVTVTSDGLLKTEVYDHD